MKKSYQAMLTLLCSFIAFCATGQSISGSTVICAGANTTLTGTPGGGTWSSGATGVATIGLSTGVLTGVSAGVSVITYFSSAGNATTTVTVNPLPAPIGGVSAVCTGSSIILSDATAGGTWSSGNTAIGTIDATGMAAGIAAGLVTMSYTLPTGCYATKPVTVNASPAPISGPSSLCEGSTATYTSSPAGGVWFSSNPGVGTVDGASAPSTTFAAITAGTTNILYLLTSVSCLATKTVTVTSTPAGPISGPGVVCIGGNITLIHGGATGGVWSASNSNASVTASSGVVTGASAGTVTISYAATGSCGAATATYVVTVNIAPPAIVGSSTICTGVESTFTNPATGGTWSSSAPALGSINATTGVSMGIAAGAITISYSLSGGCVATKPVTVQASPSPISGASSVCVGGTTTLSATPTGGAWVSTAPAVGTVDAVTGVLTGVSTGSTLVYYILGGCLVNKPVNVGATTGGISGPTTTCVGSTILLSVPVAGGTWSASNANATVSAGGIVTGMNTGAVTITYAVTTACGPAMSTYGITVSATPAPITGTALICQGSAVTLSHPVAGGTWSSGNTAVGTIDASTGGVTGIAAGTSTITYTLASGCQVTRVLTVNPLPTVSGTATLCAGSTTTFSGTPAGGTWVSGSTTIGTINAATGVFTGIATGTGLVYYILGTGCTASISVTVSPGSGPAGPITGPTAVCAGGSILLTGATAGGTWSASNANATVLSGGMVNGVTAGTVTITYALSGSCGSAIATTIITVTAAPAAIAGPSAVCTGSAITLTNTVSGGSWTSATPAIASIGAATGLLTGLTAGTTMVTYSIGSCMVTKAITVNPVPGAITGTIALCTGTTTTLASTGAGGSWSSSNVAVGTINSASGVFAGITAGTATVSYTLAATGCASTAVVTVGVLAAGPITGPSAVCTGRTITLAGATPGGTWTASNANATVSAAGIVTGVSAGTVAISYTVSGTCGTASAGKVVTVSASPAAITGSASVCVGSVTTLASATGGGTWSSANTAIGTIALATGVLTGISSGTTTISYTLPTGCAATIVATVGILAAGPITGATAVCVGNTATLTGATPGGTWAASNANATISAAGILTGITTGTVTISYTVSGTCGTAMATTVITVNPVPTAITGITNICAGATTTLASTGVGGTWSSSNTATGTISAAGILSGIAAGTTTVSYTLPTGCASTTTVTVSTLAAGPITGPTMVCVGNTIALAGATPGGTWTAGSADATVSAAGVVSGISAGAVGISYTVSAACGTAIAVSVITVNPTPAAVSGAALCAGGTATLTSASAGGTWSSSNAGIATINAATGLVSGVAAGTATMSYTLASGCATTAIVTVNALPAAISGPTDVLVGSSITLASATTGGAWSAAPVTVAIIDVTTGVVTGVSAGIASITYATGSCMVTYTVTVNDIPSSVITTAAAAGNLSIYPNPVSGGVAKLQWSGQQAGNAVLMLTDVSGREVYKTTIELNAAEGKLQLELPNVKAGVYFMSISSATIHYMNKMVIAD